MKLKSLLSVLVLIAAAKVSAISYDAAVNGTTAPAGASFTALPVGSALGTKTYGGVTVLGVKGGYAGNEIDNGQAVQVDFLAKQIIKEISIGLLYNGPEFSDINEIAVVTANGTKTYKLTATGNTTYTWTGLGSVTNVSPAIINKGGLWKIVNPFGGLQVLGLYFNSEASVQGTRADFGIASFETIKAPDAASTIALAGLSLIGLGFIARRKK